MHLIEARAGRRSVVGKEHLVPAVWVVGLILVASGCAEPPGGQSDPSFLSGEPCAAPCWYGLVPGVSNEAQVMATLSGLSFIDPNSLRQLRTAWMEDQGATVVRFGCTYQPMVECGFATISMDVLKALSLMTHRGLTLGLVLEKVGTPEYLEFGLIGAERLSCDMRASYPTMGIAAQVFTEGAVSLCGELNSGGRPSSDLPIHSLVYAVHEAFSPVPAGCCERVPWP